MLDLSYSGKHRFPSTWRGDTTVKSVDISGNNLRDVAAVSNELRHLPNLEFLNYSSCRLTSESIDALCDLSLVELTVDGNELGTIPPGIKRLGKTLLSLSACRCELNAFPTAVLQLPRLAVLRLASNRISSLPIEIGNLRSLTSLDVCDNVLTVLPESLGQLRSLTSLEASDNKLRSLPTETLSRLNHLNYLGVQGNPLAMPGDVLQLFSLLGLSCTDAFDKVEDPASQPRYLRYVHGISDAPDPDQLSDPMPDDRLTRDTSLRFSPSPPLGHPTPPNMGIAVRPGPRPVANCERCTELRDELSGAAEQYELMMSANEEELRVTQEQLSDRMRQLSECRQLLRDLKTEKDASDARVEELKEEISLDVAALETAQKRAREAEAQTTVQERKAAVLQSEVEASRGRATENRDLIRQNALAEKELVRLRSQVDSLSERLKAENKRADDAEASADRLRREKIGLNKEAASLREHLDKKQRKCDESQKKIDELLRDLAAARASSPAVRPPQALPRAQSDSSNAFFSSDDDDLAQPGMAERFNALQAEHRQLAVRYDLVAQDRAQLLARLRDMGHSTPRPASRASSRVGSSPRQYLAHTEEDHLQTLLGGSAEDKLRARTKEAALLRVQGQRWRNMYEEARSELEEPSSHRAMDSYMRTEESSFHSSPRAVH